MADTAELTKSGFTREQAEALRNMFRRKAEHGFDRPTQMWLFSGMLALGLAAAGFIWAEINALRAEVKDEIRSVRTELSADIAAKDARQNNLFIWG